MKTCVPLFVLLSAIFLTNACDSIINGINELPEDPNTGAENPNDPNSDSFILPGIMLTNGASFDQPFTITSNSLSLGWQIVDNDGFSIDFEYDFRYRIASPSQELSQQSYLDVTEQGFTIDNLVETFNNEAYRFEIEATYRGSSTTKDTTFTGSFYVDASQFRGFLFNTDTITENSDGTYTATIYLDEIEAIDDLTAFSLIVNYDGSLLNVVEESIRVFDESDSFLSADGVDEIIWFTDIGSSILTIDVGLAGSNRVPLSGGGAICEITFEATQGFGETIIGISSGSVLKASNGTDIAIQGFDQATLIE